MSAIIDTLKNKLGVLVYPKTLTKAVYDETTQDRLDNTLGSVTLTTTAQNLKGAINEVNAKSITGTSPITSTTVGTVTTITHNTSGVTAGTYKSLTVDNKGHVTGGTNPTTLAGYNITDAAPITSLTLKNKNVACYGTSITWGQMQASPPYVSSINYPNTFSTITGCNVTNKGIGGTNMATNGGAYDSNAFCNRVDTEDFSAYDYVIIEYGTNDYGNSIPIGDNSNMTKSFFKGAMRYSINKLLTLHPNLKITFLTPMFASTSYTKNSIGLTISDYVDAVIEVAGKYNLPIIDLHNGMGINQQNYASLYWDSSLHPSEATYVRMGTFIAQLFPGKAIKPVNNLLWKTLTLSGGAVAGTPAPSYCVDDNQFVHFRGIITVGTSGQVQFTMPTEVRPSYGQTLSLISGSSASFIAITTGGAATFGISNAQMDLASVSSYYIGTPNVI